MASVDFLMDAFYLMHGGVIILYEYDELACMHVTHVCGQTDTRMNTWICTRDEIVSIDRSDILLRSIAEVPTFSRSQPGRRNRRGRLGLTRVERGVEL